MKKYLFICLLILVFISFFVFQNCKKSDDEGGTDLLADLAGNWAGTWTDTKFNMSGNVTVTFTVNGSTITAAGTIDLSGFFLGTLPWTGTGAADGNTITFSFTALNFVNGTGTVNGTTATGNGTISGVLSFGDFTFTGTITGSKISGNFDFVNPAGGEGTIVLNKN